MLVRRNWSTILKVKGAQVQVCFEPSSAESTRFGLLARHNPKNAHVPTKWAYTITDLQGTERNSTWWLKPGARPLGHASSWMPGGPNPSVNSPSDVTFRTRLLWRESGQTARASRTKTINRASIPAC